MSGVKFTGTETKSLRWIRKSGHWRAKIGYNKGGRKDVLRRGGVAMVKCGEAGHGKKKWNGAPRHFAPEINPLKP